MNKKFGALRRYTVDDVKKWILKDDIDNDQAWHLLVAYILYQELNGKYCFSSVGEV